MARRTAALVCAWAAAGALSCSDSGSGDDYPVRGGTGIGGGGGTGGVRIDAGAIDAAPTTGRVCLTSDLRRPDQCANTGAANISVTRGMTTVLTSANGTFTLPPATESGNWRATRNDLVTSVVPYVAGNDVLIPAVTIATWTAVRQNNDITLVDGQGSLLVSSYKPGGLYKSGVTVTTDPAGQLGAFYDTDVARWSKVATGSYGAALVADLRAGAVNVGAQSPNGSRSASQVPIVEGAITYLRLDFAK